MRLLIWLVQAWVWVIVAGSIFGAFALLRGPVLYRHYPKGSSLWGWVFSGIVLVYLASMLCSPFISK